MSHDTPIFKFKALTCQGRSFKLGDEDMSLLKVAVVVNPLSEQAQKWSPLIQVGNSLGRRCREAKSTVDFV